MATTREWERDRELLIPVGEAVDRDDLASSSPSVTCPPASSHHLHHTTVCILLPPLRPCLDTIDNCSLLLKQQALSKFIRSWASKKFMTGCVILSPIAITSYLTWWFINFVDGFFSPIYAHLGINIFGLGFVTSITFIFFVGVFMSSWLGASVLSLGEWLIKKMPLVSYIYTASKQISAAISPDQTSRAFKEVVILRHPRIGEYVIGFITSIVVLQKSTGDEELSCVYVPTNHLYLGDIFLVNSKEVVRPDLSVREAIEIVASVGMSMPRSLTTVGMNPDLVEHVRLARSPKFASTEG